MRYTEMTNTLKHRPEAELKEIAAKIAENITLRTYYHIGNNGEHIQSSDGNSEDTTRTTTATEKEKIYTIAYGSLLAINWRRNYPESFQGILDAAEFTLDVAFEKDFEVNGYITIYIVIARVHIASVT